MKFIKSHYLFESKSEKSYYTPKNLIIEICAPMTLLNNEFLDNLIDRGLKARYSENSQVFLTDLKNLLLAKNRLVFGKFENGKCIEDEEISKINGFFNEVEFDIEKNWDLLINSRNIARSIQDKLLSNQKLESSMISKIFWIGPNKNENYQEDIVVELLNGNQYSFYLNKNISLQKSASFNSFAEELIGENLDNLFKEDNITKWDKLTQEWIRIIYENSNKSCQSHIEKFIDTKRIDSIGYFEYFDIRHRDPRYKYLGEYIKDFEKNILKFSDLLNEIWKNKEKIFLDLSRVEKEWYETKVVILNSRILENIFTTSLKKDKSEDVVRLESGFKRSSGVVKMKLMKVIVNKMLCMERPVYYVTSKGDFTQVPSRSFFRDNYDKLDVQFDYHVKFKYVDIQSENDFNFKIKVFMENELLCDLQVSIGFSGGEFSGKLNCKYKFILPQNFNYLVSKTIEEI